MDIDRARNTMIDGRPSVLPIAWDTIIAAAILAAAILAAVLLVATLMTTACNRSSSRDSDAGHPAPRVADSTATKQKPAPGHLLGTDSAPNLHALFDTVEARLRRGDTVGLVRLMIDDSAYRRDIFPSSPAYDASSEDAFRFVLAMHKANSSKGLRRVLTDVLKPDSARAVLLRAVDSVPVPGGMVYHVLPGEGIRPFGTALRTGSAVRIATFGQPAASRPRGGSSRAPAAGG